MDVQSYDLVRSITQCFLDITKTFEEFSGEVSMTVKFRGRQWILMGSVVGLIAIAFATRGIDLFGQAAADRPQMSDQAFKNIQVLKGIPVDEFMGTMGLF